MRRRINSRLTSPWRRSWSRTCGSPAFFRRTWNACETPRGFERFAVELCEDEITIDRRRAENLPLGHLGLTVTPESLDGDGVDRDRPQPCRGLRRLEDQLVADRNELLDDRDRSDLQP